MYTITWKVFQDHDQSVTSTSTAGESYFPAHLLLELLIKTQEEEINCVSSVSKISFETSCLM